MEERKKTEKHTYTALDKELFPNKKYYFIRLDKALFFLPKSIDIFLISARKHILWELNEALLISTHNMFLCRNKKNIFWIPMKNVGFAMKEGIFWAHKRLRCLINLKLLRLWELELTMSWGTAYGYKR